MNWLDMRTVMFSHIITDILSIVVVFFLWRQNRRRYQGISLWLAGFSLQLLGTILIVVRGSIPDWMSMTLANTIILAGAMTVVEGISRFLGPTRSRIPAIILLAAFAAANFYFLQFRPSIDARNLALSAGFSLIFIDVLRLIYRTRGEMRRIIGRIGLAYIALLLVSVIRIVVVVAGPPDNQDFFKASGFETMILLAYQTLFILLTYNLALTVNERLIGDLRFQEEKFAKAFRSSPFGFALTDVFSGKIFDLNEGFSGISGYSRNEAIGKTESDLNIWEDEEGRRRAHEELNLRGKIREIEFRLRTKSGGMLTCLWSAEVIVIGGRPYVLSCFNNISILKQAQEALRESLQEKELLMKELKHRVKNSLTVVSSLIFLSREGAADPAVKTILADLRTRVGLVSLVYEQFDRTGRVDAIGLKVFIQNLADALAQSYGPPEGRVRITTDLEDLFLESDKALPLGLILNELVINAFKNAFPGDRSGEIRIELLSMARGMCLMVSDDGIGRTLKPVSEEGKTSSLIVESFADQISARISYPPGSGTTAVVLF